MRTRTIPSFFAAALLSCAPAFSYQWSLRGSLNGPRFFHTAVLLQNGNVLVSGGIDGNYNTAKSAEVYDPGSGSWTRVGNMSVAREFHTLTLLPDARVLAAGGAAGSTVAEIFNPSTGAWTVTGPMNAARTNQTATLLPNGKVLVAGGSADGTSAELFDPASGVWTPTAPMNQGRDSHTATLLANGRVLVAAGCSEAIFCTPVDSAEIYDPASATWTLTSRMTTIRFAATAVALPSGKVLVTGGMDGGGVAIHDADLFNPSAGTWTYGGSTANAHVYHSAALALGGKVVVAGGYDESTFAVATTEIYSPNLGTWGTVAPMTTGVYGGAGVALKNGALLVSGGLDRNFSPTATTEVLLPGAQGLITFSPSAPDFGTVRSNTNSAPLPITIRNAGAQSVTVSAVSASQGFSVAGNCVGATLAPLTSCTELARFSPLFAGVFGGTLTVQDDASGSPNSVPMTGLGTNANWTAGASMSYPRFAHTATLLGDSTVLVAGGGCDGFSYSLPHLAELYDPVKKSWAYAGSLHDVRGSHSANLLNTGRVLVAGGCGESTTLASAEVYDPATATWSVTGSMSAARKAHTGTTLPDGRVLVAGGGTSTAELYDPGTGLWTPAQPMHLSRTGHTATLLPNGDVLVAGGGTSAAELFNPASGVWTSTLPMNDSRQNHTATLLPSGKVLVSGGEHYCDPEFGFCSTTNASETYEPSAGTWSRQPNMLYLRQAQTATTLPGGDVLVVGGEDPGDLREQNSTDLFTP